MARQCLLESDPEIRRDPQEIMDIVSAASIALDLDGTPHANQVSMTLVYFGLWLLDQKPVDPACIKAYATFEVLRVKGREFRNAAVDARLRGGAN